MGFFSSKPDVSLPNIDGIVVPDWLHDQLPDPGALLLDMYGGVDPDVQRQVADEIARVRFPNGGYDLDGVDVYDKRGGPLSLLSWITAGDWICVQVWATHDLGGSQKREVKSTVGSLCRSQGIPTAVAWAETVRSSTGRSPSLSIANLADSLTSTYDESRGKLTNGRFIDSIRKWRR